MDKDVNFYFEKFHKIFSHIRAEDIMKKDVVFLNRGHTLWQAKELMRIKKISGVPIIDKKRCLIGIVSIEDIIVALEKNYISDLLENHMTKSVITVAPEDNMEKIIQKFNRFDFGRFPVVDKNCVLKGLITKNDILETILGQFTIIYDHDVRREEMLNKEMEWFNKSLITGNTLDKKEADFEFHIQYTDVNLAGMGAARLKKFLNSKMNNPELVRKASIATYEAEVNVVIHSGSNGYLYCWFNDKEINVRIEDHGKGIENVDKAMQEGFSTASDHVRELGFGAGIGLVNMKRYSDKMVVVSEVGKGVVVEMSFYNKTGGV